MAKKSNTLMMFGLLAAGGVALYYYSRNAVPNVQLAQWDWVTNSGSVYVNGNLTTIPAGQALSLPGSWSVVSNGTILQVLDKNQVLVKVLATKP